jgi:uncharacterized protein (TIGR02147 family)
MEGIKSPDVRSYLDARLFLKDYYEHRKKKAKTFSYETWAAELGIKSKSFLRHVLIGDRTISEALTQKFCLYFSFNDSEKEYFLLLVLYTQSESPEQKKIYGRKLITSLREDKTMDLVPPTHDLLADPGIMVLRNLLSFEDLSRTPENLARLLGVSLDHVSAQLKFLEQEKLAFQAGNEWKSTHQNVRVADKLADEGIRLYHRRSLAKALEAQALAPQERSYRSLNLAFNEEEYASYLQDLGEFVKMLFAKYGGEELLDRRIYQVNFNLIPWTTRAQSGSNTPKKRRNVPAGPDLRQPESP